jgi:MoaA/NifB/PqqE/SkfB family radical SAM enzyme
MTQKYELSEFLSRYDPWMLDGDLVNESRTINMDISNKCTLACMCCRRQMHMKKYGEVLGETLAVEDFEKYIKHFDKFDFSGQVSDPTMHPHFEKILQVIIDNEKSAAVHNAASHKPIKWYRELFEQCSNDKIEWFFGIDGLPKDSHKYRKRQDGEKLFEVMKMATKYMKGTNIIWKYIVFKYNQDNIEECRQIAEDMGVTFNVVYSNRYPSPEFIPDPKFQAHVPMLNIVYKIGGEVVRF